MWVEILRTGLVFPRWSIWGVTCLGLLWKCTFSHLSPWKHFNTLWGFQQDIWENIHFQSKPMHVTPQINHLGKMSPVLRVSTHIYRVSKEKDGKTFIFRVNLGMWPLKSIVSENKCYIEAFNTHLWGFQKDRWEKNHSERKPRHVTP